MNIYQPNQSALTNAFKSQATLTEQKIIFLEQSLNKAQRDLNDVRFQQNHLKSKREDLIQNYHKTNRKLLKQIDELQNLINNNQSYITLDQLITAFKNNNWNDHIARYCNENKQFNFKYGFKNFRFSFNQLIQININNLKRMIFIFQTQLRKRFKCIIHLIISA